MRAEVLMVNFARFTMNIEFAYHWNFPVIFWALICLRGLSLFVVRSIV